MSKPSNEQRASAERTEKSGVSDLASRALGVLASRRSTDGRLRDWVDRLHDAVIDRDPGARDVVLHDMLGAGLTSDEICDVLVPAVARRLGDEWCEDEMSFADVTIGSARLQALLRDVALRSDHDPVQGRGEMMVLVIADEYHTLGAMVLTGQLRRQSASVRLVLGRPRAEIGQIVEDGAFDAILLSVAISDQLDHVKELIEILRKHVPASVPLIVGGGILEIGPEAVREATGADHVTNDPREALRLAGHATESDQAP